MAERREDTMTVRAARAAGIATPAASAAAAPGEMPHAATVHVNLGLLASVGVSVVLVIVGLAIIFGPTVTKVLGLDVPWPPMWLGIGAFALGLPTPIVVKAKAVIAAWKDSRQ
jgi:hypothetical protein